MRRMLIVIAFLSGVLVWMICPAHALAAAGAVEMVRPRGLLLMGPIQQAVGFRYEYYGRDVEEASSSTHRFRERYSLNTGAAVWDPDLLNLNLNVDFWYQQQKNDPDAGNSDTSDSFKMTYSLLASAFEHSPYPVIVRSSREETDTSYSFAPSYRTTLSRNSINVKARNKILPAFFHYQHLTSDTSGRVRDSSTTSDVFHLIVTHNVSDLSHTQLDVNFSDHEQEVEETGSTQSDVAIFSLSNALYLDREKNYSLSSQFNRQEANVANESHDSHDITETLRARFGLALIGEATYQYTFDRMPGFDGREQELTTDNVDLTLTHQLFQSLQTSLNWHWRDARLNGGDESQTRYGIGVQYRKFLPRASHLQVSVGGWHQETDRDLGVGKIRVKRQFQGVMRNEPIELDVNGGTLLEVERVAGQVDGEADHLFSEGTDYEVDFVFARIIPIGNDFPDPVLDPGNPGVTVEVTYIVGVESPSIAYETDSYSASTSLSLLQGRYRILASYYNEEQTQLSGDIADRGLYDITDMEVRGEARYDYHRFGLEYGSHEAGASQYSYLEGEWYYDRIYGWGNVRLQARDRLTSYDAVEGRSGYDVNTLILGAGYSRRILTLIQWVLSVSYANVNGDDVSRDAIYFRTGLQGWINKLYFNVNGTSTLRMDEDRTTRDDFFSFDITRYF